jgi:hypothetical protein
LSNKKRRFLKKGRTSEAKQASKSTKGTSSRNMSIRKQQQETARGRRKFPRRTSRAKPQASSKQGEL